MDTSSRMTLVFVLLMPGTPRFSQTSDRLRTFHRQLVSPLSHRMVTYLDIDLFSGDMALRNIGILTAMMRVDLASMLYTLVQFL